MGFETLGKKYQDGADRADSDKILEVLVGDTAWASLYLHM